MMRSFQRKIPQSECQAGAMSKLGLDGLGKFRLYLHEASYFACRFRCRAARARGYGFKGPRPAIYQEQIMLRTLTPQFADFTFLHFWHGYPVALATGRFAAQGTRRTCCAVDPGAAAVLDITVWVGGVPTLRHEKSCFRSGGMIRDICFVVVSVGLACG